MKHDEPHPWLDQLYSLVHGSLKWLKQVWCISSTIIYEMCTVAYRSKKSRQIPIRINLHSIRFTDVSVNAIQIEQIYRSTTMVEIIDFYVCDLYRKLRTIQKEKKENNNFELIIRYPEMGKTQTWSDHILSKTLENDIMCPTQFWNWFLISKNQTWFSNFNDSSFRGFRQGRSDYVENSPQQIN